MSNDINRAKNITSNQDQPSVSDGKTSPRKELRKPHESTHLRLANGPDSRDSSLSPVKKTTLSATAKEFVPKFVTQNQTAYSLSASAAECVPRQPAYPVFSQNNLFEDFQRLVNIGPHEVSKAGPSQSVGVITRSFSNTLYEMTIQPGSVEDAMRPILEMLKNCPEDSAVHSIIDILFEQSVLEPNFRYTGAKVVQYLSNALKNIPTFTDFRKNFLTRCKEEYFKKEELISQPESVSRLCGFTMFMGELFLNLEVEKDGVKQKAAVIRFVIRDLLLVLLQHPTDETVKCATQLLKMAGASIEDTAHLHAKPEEGSYNEVFTLLSQLSSNQHLNKTSNLLINSVLNLKSNNWGRRESVSSQSNTSSQYSQNYTAYSLSASAAECVPRQPAYPVFSQNNLFEDFQRLVKIGPHEVSKAGLSQSVEVITRSFSNTLYEMTIQPGSFEDAMRPIVEMLKNCPEDSAVHSIVYILFEQSVSEPNFRYTGAKVVQYLSNALKNIPTFADFRNKILIRCKEEYLKKEELISHPESVSRLWGFAMFMGELFLKLEVEIEGVKQQIAVIRFVIRDLLLVLLQHPTDETVKCATQLLKMAGASIEDTAHLHAKPEEGSYNEVFTLLSQLSSNQHLNKTSNLLINSVLNLKSNNWGRRESVSSQPNTSSQYSQNYTNEPIFYNSQGQPITREEAGFNDYNTYLMAEEEAAEEYARWEAGELDDGQYYESWSAFPENYDYQQIENYDDNNFMDDEMKAAYEEFLKSQVQGRHHH